MLNLHRKHIYHSKDTENILITWFYYSKSGLDTVTNTVAFAT